MTMTNFDAIYKTVKQVADELNCDMIEAASKMQGQAAKKGDEKMISELHNFKMKVAGL